MPEEVIAESPLMNGTENETPKTESSVVAAPEVPVVPEKAPERIEGKYQELLSRVTPTKTASPTDDDHEDTVVLDAKHIGAMTDEESKVQKLLDLASTKGVIHAVKVARSLKDAYALDRMHDELSNKLYDGLLERGLITRE